MRRVAVIGATGLLGQYIAKEGMRRGYEVLGTFKSNSSSSPQFQAQHLDITDPGEVSELLTNFAPDSVILASALTSVDYCEMHPTDSWNVNVEGTLNVAVACKKLKAKLLYVSTDYVFNGEKGEPYFEFENPDPANVYARTKLEGERLTMDASHENIVARVSVLYGWNRLSRKQNFVTWVLDSLRSGKEIKLLTDQFVSPTYAPQCASVLFTILERKGMGIYHTSGPDCLNRYQIGMKAAEVFGLNQGLIKKATEKEVSLPARRPPCSCLSTSKLEGEFNIHTAPLAEGLEAMRSTEG